MKGVYKAGAFLLNVWPERADSRWKYSKCKYCYTCSITFVPFIHTEATPRQFWTEIQLTCVIIRGKDWELAIQKVRSRGTIHFSLHSASAWKEALSKQIACSQNIFCVQLSGKKAHIFRQHKTMFDCKIRQLDQCCNVLCIVACWWI